MLQIQFYVLLMMGVMDTRNMYSNFSVNKYMNNVASGWISSTYNETIALPDVLYGCKNWHLTYGEGIIQRYYENWIQSEDSYKRMS